MIVHGLSTNDNGKIDLKLDAECFTRDTYTGNIPALGWEERFAYGVEWNADGYSYDCTRIGNMALHKSLPVQKGIKGCLLDNDGNVVEYLPGGDWSSVVRDGSKGQVMVEIPKHYRKCMTSGSKRQVWISEMPLNGYTLVPKMYVSAYEASWNNLSEELSSVVNLNEEYRGGDRSKDYDSDYFTLLGKPRTNDTRAHLRQYARKRKKNSTEWNIMTYEAWCAVYWLFVVEYATRNTQKTFNGQLDRNGYRQGGLGSGVTTLNVENVLDVGENPMVSCGASDIWGNQTMSHVVQVPLWSATAGSSYMVNVQVSRYRGLENLFGHIYTIVDGLNLKVSPSTAAGGDPYILAYACSDPDYFADEVTAQYRFVGNVPKYNGYITQVFFGEQGDIMPQSVGEGASSIGFCDGLITNSGGTQGFMAVPLMGGDMSSQALAGMVALNSELPLDATWSLAGTRLVFIPESE